MSEKVLQGEDVAAVAQVFHREGMPEPVGVDLIVLGFLFDPLEHALQAAVGWIRL